MKKLLMLLLLLPTLVLAAPGRLVQFPAYCFAYSDFLKQIEFFGEVPIILGIKETNEKDKSAILIGVLHNRETDTFSVIQFNNEVGCFIAAGKNLKFNLRGLTLEDIK